MKIAIINGPNLNLTGKRETGIYGNKTFEELLKELQQEFPSSFISYFQSNVEGEIINFLHDANQQSDAVILNAGAYTHTSIAIGDAVKAIKIPVVEVHISNIYSREEFRHISYITPNCEGIISGFGMDSYFLAMNFFKRKFS
jgi:3-dehydroquinate dehydratase II